MIDTLVKNINKTIIVPYADCNRMHEFCKDESGNVKRDFFDWYLKDKPELFLKSGMLIIDQAYGLNELIPISFDFSDPDNVVFAQYVYRDRSKIAEWKFKRMDNLTMETISFNMVYQNLSNFDKLHRIILAIPKGAYVSSVKERITDDILLNNKVKRGLELRNKKGYRKVSTEEIMNEAKREGNKQALKLVCNAATYFTYSLMYYVSKQEPEVIESKYSIVESENVEKVRGFYKYTGYVDLRENKIYKPTIERNPDEPVRDYNRHIEAWTVRGHYRKTSKGLIWIEPHIKGKGQLEKRIYGTEDEKELNLIPKVFEVERTVKAKATIHDNMTAKEMATVISDNMIATIEKNVAEPERPIIEELKTQNKFMAFLKNIFGKLFKSKA